MRRFAGPAIDRLMARVTTTPGPLDTDCWITSYALDGYGYAQIMVPQHVNRRCHIVVYEFLVGPVPVGFELDHLCRVRACVNPEHLEPVTRRENFLRGQHPCAVTYRTNICKRGHSMDDAYIDPSGKRRCRECIDAYARRRYERTVAT